MISLKRFKASCVAFLFTLFSSIYADRLSLTDGGYARVVRLQQYPLSSFTLSGWINVTHFPEGITPFLTYLSQDVNSQISFFLRPEGIGILWGGPSGSERDADYTQIDRRPRFYSPSEDLKREKREAIDYSGGLGDIENILTKRSMKTEDNWPPSNFVDVGTMGVYDLMVSGSEHEPAQTDDRQSRSQVPVYSKWTNVPYELHMDESEPDREYAEYSRKEPRIITQPSGNDDFVYFNWNTPTNQRDVPTTQQDRPLGNNNWSPLWESTKHNPDVASDSQVQKPETKAVQAPTKIIATPTKPQKVWASRSPENTAVDSSSKWQPPITNINFYDYTPVETKLLPTKFERPIWPLRPQQRRTTLPPTQISETTNDLFQETNIRTQQNVVKAIPSKTISNVVQEDSPSPIPNIVKAVPTNTIPTVLKTDLSNTIQDDAKAVQSNIIKLQGIQIQGTPPTITKNSYLYTTKENPTTQSSTTTVTTTFKTTKTSNERTTKSNLFNKPTNPRRNAIPSLYRYANKTKSIPVTSKQDTIKEILTHQESKQPRTRVPLWKLIKKPNTDKVKQIESRDESVEYKEDYIPSGGPVYSKNIPVFASNDSISTTEPPLVKKYKYAIPEPTLPPIKISKNNGIESLGSRRNTFRSRPVQIPTISRRPSVVKVTSATTTTTTTTTTTDPPTTSRRIPYKPTPITHKVPNYQGSKIETSKPKISLWQRKENSNQNQLKPNIPKLNRNIYDYTRANEFEKAMQDPELVKEGNTAVVYAVPITNEKEFYEMYKKYQKDSVEPSHSSVNLHELYNKMRIGATNAKQKESNEDEEEINENRIKYPEISIYKESLYPIKEPTVKADPNINKITPPTKILKENITEAPLRSDIPVEDYEEEQLQSNESQISPNINQVEDYNVEESNQSQNNYAAYDDQTISEYLNNHFYDYYNGEDLENSDTTPIQEANDTDNSNPIAIQDDYYLPMVDKTKEDLADLYRPKSIAALNPPQISPAYYQEPTKLSLEQMPPQYQKDEKEVTKNVNFDEPILEYYNPGGPNSINGMLTENNKQDILQQSNVAKQDSYQDLPQQSNVAKQDSYQDLPQQSNVPIQDSYPMEFISESFIPKPIHKADDNELENWYLNQERNNQLPQTTSNDLRTSETQNFYKENMEKSDLIPENTFSSPFVNPIQGEQILPPISAAQDVNGLSSDKLPLDIHFEKISYTFTESTWYHVAFTWNSNTKSASIFINGEQVGTIDNVLANNEQMNEGGLFLLGKALLPDLSDFDDSSQFEGEMSDVNLWATELAPPSVDALFQCKYDPNYPQPIEWDTTELKLYDSANITSSPPLCGLVT